MLLGAVRRAMSGKLHHWGRGTHIQRGWISGFVRSCSMESHGGKSNMASSVIFRSMPGGDLIRVGFDPSNGTLSFAGRDQCWLYGGHVANGMESLQCTAKEAAILMVGIEDERDKSMDPHLKNGMTPFAAGIYNLLGYYIKLDQINIDKMQTLVDVLLSCDQKRFCDATFVRKARQKIEEYEETSSKRTITISVGQMP